VNPGGGRLLPAVLCFLSFDVWGVLFQDCRLVLATD